MRYPKHTLFLFCNLGCGRIVGSAQTFEPMTQEEYQAKSDQADIRCNECEAEHGTFRDMVVEAEQKLGVRKENIEMVKANRKRSDFTRALSAEVAKVEKERAKNKL